MSSYVHALPMRAVVQMCGMPVSGSDTQQLVDDLRISLDAGEGDDPVAAYGRVGDRLRQLVKDKRAAPGLDVTSRMVTHGAGLTDEEIVQDLISVIAAAQQPTANWICNTLRLLLTDERFAVNVSGGRLQRRRGAQRGAVAGHPDAELHRPLGRTGHPARRPATSGRATAWSSDSPRPTPTRRSGRRVTSAPRTPRTCRSAAANTAAPTPHRCWPT